MLLIEPHANLLSARGRGFWAAQCVCCMSVFCDLPSVRVCALLARGAQDKTGGKKKRKSKKIRRVTAAELKDRRVKIPGSYFKSKKIAFSIGRVGPAIKGKRGQFKVRFADGLWEIPLADFKPHLMPIGDYSDVRDIMVEAGADTDGESESESESDEIDHEAAEMAAAQLDVARCLDSDTAGEDD